MVTHRFSSKQVSIEGRLIDREMSDLSFMERVLEEAENVRHPVLERVRFLAITGMLVDEFYRIRVAGLRERLRGNEIEEDRARQKLRRHLAAVDERAGELIRKQDACWRALRGHLRRAGIVILDANEIRAAEHEWLEQHFETKVRPRLRPAMIESQSRLPFIRDGEVFLVMELVGLADDSRCKAVLPLPRRLPRFVPVSESEPRFVTLESVLSMFAQSIFPAHRVGAHGLARVIREGNLKLDDYEDDPLALVSRAIRARDHAPVTRLKVNGDMPESLRRYLAAEFDVVEERDLEALDGADLSVTASPAVTVDNLLGLADAIELPRGLTKEQKTNFVYPRPLRRRPAYWRSSRGDLFQAVAEKDRLLHFPYDDFRVFTDFLAEAARDESVTQIQQTLYRSGHKSRIVRALARASELGKRVRVVIELKAREDELENVKLAKRLAAAGCEVLFGTPQLKVHAKVLLVDRVENGVSRTYVNLSTGNYYARTAKSYTDLSLLSANEALAADARKLFDFAVDGRIPAGLAHLSIAPLDLRAKLVELIETEIAHAAAGRPASIWIKANQVSDPELIALLYRASQCGVEIDVVVRSVCRLLPGVPGLSERIRVRSVVGRFLEHSRLYCFGNGAGLPSADAKVYVASADLMPHKLDNRIEVLVPILQTDIKERIQSIVQVYLRDVAQSWHLDADAQWTRLRLGDFSAQEALMRGALDGSPRT